MTRLFGILIEENKELWKCLCDIPGVSKKVALRVCKDLGLFSRAPWKKMTDKQRRSIYNWFMKNIIPHKVLGTDLRRKHKSNKNELMKLGTMRGIRLRQGLPVRGQNTHSNARTARKKLNFLFCFSFEKFNLLFYSKDLKKSKSFEKDEG